MQNAFSSCLSKTLQPREAEAAHSFTVISTKPYRMPAARLRDHGGLFHQKPCWADTYLCLLTLTLVSVIPKRRAGQALMRKPALLPSRIQLFFIRSMISLLYQASIFFVCLFLLPSLTTSFLICRIEQKAKIGLPSTA